VRQALSASPTWPLQSSAPALLVGAVDSAAFKRRHLNSGTPVMPLHSFGVPAPLSSRPLRLRFNCWQLARAVPVMPPQSCVAPRGTSGGATCANVSVAAQNVSAESMHLEAMFMMFSEASPMWLHFAAAHRTRKSAK
jgi:hypothetical protein